MIASPGLHPVGVLNLGFIPVSIAPGYPILGFRSSLPFHRCPYLVFSLTTTY